MFDQKGITGLETAIVLIAFVVVASVFAFAVLGTGLLSSEKSKETVLGGLEETQSTITLRGSVIAHSSSTGAAGEIRSVVFQVSNATQGAEGVNLAGTAVVVTYIDENQVVNLANSSSATSTSNTQGWSATWLSGTSPLLDADERAEFVANPDRPRDGPDNVRTVQDRGETPGRRYSGRRADLARGAQGR